MHALSERAVLRCHLRDPVEDRLQTVGLLCALLAIGAQLGGALLHRGTLLGAEAVGFTLGILRGHSRAFRHSGPARSLPSAQRLGPTTSWRYSIPDRGAAKALE